MVSTASMEAARGLPSPAVMSKATVSAAVGVTEMVSQRSWVAVAIASAPEPSASTSDSSTRRDSSAATSPTTSSAVPPFQSTVGVDGVKSDRPSS